MKVVVVYRDNEEYTRLTDEWLVNYEAETGESVEKISPDSIDGEQFCRVHDVVRYPTILVLTDDGSELGRWSDGLPLISDVLYLAES